MTRPGRAARLLASALCFLVLAVSGLHCTSGPSWRTIHLRLVDTLHAKQTVQPYSTASYPRDTIAGDTRPVLSATPPGTPVFVHGRVSLDVPADARLELAYGVRVRGLTALPPDAAARFRIELETSGGKQKLFEEVLRPETMGYVPWRDASIALPRSTAATLVFTTEVPPAYAWKMLPQFAAPTVTVPTRAARPRNVILISLDTLRADHLGIYGYQRPTSPHMDRLFSTEGVVVDRVLSQAANTPGGHVAMLKGMWPTTVIRRDGARFWHRPAVLSIAEVLRADGYRTAAFTEDALVDGPVGFNRGFDDAYHEETKTEGPTAGQIEQTFDRGIDWLTRHRDEPLFLFLHTYQVHHPYTPPAEYAQRFPSPAGAPPPERDRDLNDAEIAYTDEQVRRLVQRIDELGLRENTILVITADHGEEFGEHGRRWHGSNATSEILHIPLLLRAPGLLPAGVRRDGPVALMDLVPTLLTLLGRKTPDIVQGHSQTEHLLNGVPVVPRPIFSEAQGDLAETYGGLDSWWPPSIAVTQWPWRMVRIRTDAKTGVRYELYNLDTDPGERNNLFAERGSEHDALRVAVDLYEPTAQSEALSLESRLSDASDGAKTPLESDPAREEKMRALGYIH